MREGEAGSKACNIVNKFKLSTGKKKALIIFLYRTKQLISSEPTLIEKDLLS